VITRVFVSSTYLDLKDHRAVVDATLNQMGHSFRGMEYIGSRPYEPKRACFNEIGNCDIFVGIYAHRYGWIPRGATTSITEQEFDRAKALGKPCYCYKVSPSYPWAPDMMERDAESKLLVFLKKVSELVRSEFTTPDDLARKLAADLNAHAIAGHEMFEYADLLEHLQEGIRREISATVGRKYIRNLYVGRRLESTLKRYVLSAKTVTRSIGSQVATLAELRDMIRTDELSKEIRKDVLDSLVNIRESIADQIEPLSSFRGLATSDAKLCFPAIELTTILTKISSILNEALKQHNFNRLSRWTAAWSSRAFEAMNQSESILKSIAPVLLVVDRAGGGKTNLFCRISEELSTIVPCFFISARSIVRLGEDAIVEHLAKNYGRLGDDPIDAAIQLAAPEDFHTVVVIDAINENLDLKRFSVVLKSTVKRYYGRPVIFLISCRDIYWEFFKDDWWSEHCRHVSQGELYEFTRREFQSALPLYLSAYNIQVNLDGAAQRQLLHPLLLRFFCEAYQGPVDKPSQLPPIDDIRLLELFDIYCNRKFDQIQRSLSLQASDEIMRYLWMIARLMLDQCSRLVEVSTVSELAQRDFGERSLRVPESRYIHIIDEDILLEEELVGREFNPKVGFVYDEFMEYVIAKAVWSDLSQESNEPLIERLKHSVTGLLKKGRKFVSVAGVVIYLGELLARKSYSDALFFFDWLVAQNREDIACRSIVRWVTTGNGDAAFHRLLNLHKVGRSASIRHEAWKAMESICLFHWEIFFQHIKGMELKGYYRLRNVASMLSRYGGGPTGTQALESIEWIVVAMRKESRKFSGLGIPSNESSDITSGALAVSLILEMTTSEWNEEELAKARLLRDESHRIAYNREPNGIALTGDIAR
jgi:hypothetical protein